jgi:hypothetical protein
MPHSIIANPAIVKATAGGSIRSPQGIRPNGESYSQKWQYVRENPVRAALVARTEEWPYSGRVHEIRWSGD